MEERTPLFHGDLVNTSRVIYTPSEFAKVSLMYIQEIGSLQATRPHTSRRSDLSSYLFFIVLSGAGELRYEGCVYPLQAGDCVFIDCTKSYSHQTSDDLWRLLWVHFNGPTVSSIYRKYTERGGLPAFHPDSLENYRGTFERIYDAAVSTSYIRDMEINACLSKLLVLLMADSWHPDHARSGSKKTELLRIKQYLDENYEKKVTLDELSQRYFINKFYLTRVFKAHFGVTIGDYLLNARITKAKNLLRFTDKSAEEIGQECGIGDVYYFSKVFKKAEGVTVREYRERWK